MFVSENVHYTVSMIVTELGIWFQHTVMSEEEVNLPLVIKLSFNENFIIFSENSIKNRLPYLVN